MTTKHFCPACAEPVIYRSGPNTMPHFAHRKNSVCSTTSDAESSVHLAGKMTLYEILSQENPQVYLEKYLPEIKQKSDIYIVRRGRQYAIEFQCSQISLSIFRKRSEGYLSQGIVPIWIFNHKLVRRLKSGQWQVPGLIQMGITEKAHLLTFDPHRNQLFSFSGLIPFSSNHFFTHTTIATRSQITLNKLLTPESEKTDFYSVWLKKRNYHVYIRPRLEGLRVPFYRRLYQSGYYLTTLPAFVGIPMNNGFLIRTPALEWQGSIFLVLVQRKQISVTELKQIVTSLIEACEIKPANLPLVQRMTPMDAVNEFLRVLCFCGFLTPNGRQGYRIDAGSVNDIDVTKLYRFLQKFR